MENIKNNPYSIKDKNHVFKRAQEREIDINEVSQKLCADIPVGIEKFNESSKFELLYKYKPFMDLCIVIHRRNRSYNYHGKKCK